MIKVGSDFSGVGAFDQALIRLGIDYETVFSCDMDKYARQTYIENYGEPGYYPKNVYDREIPKESLDIYMTSPPCQAFSLAGNRKGESEERGVLFYNSHEFILKNKPRFFIFENVKGLLSDDGGKTFQRWIDYLSKSVNGQPVIFPHEESANYHVYHKVLNSKDYGVPQNRERIFIVGIRDDQDNRFLFPPKEHLTKKLKDVLEDEVDEKYFLSEKMINGLLKKNNQNNGFTFKPKTGKDTGSCVTARCFKMGADDNYIKVSKEVRTKESKEQRKKTGTNDFRGKEIEFREQDHMNTITTSLTNDHFIQIKSATKSGYETAKEGDSINFSVPSSKTRRGRVGKGVAQTLDTACNQAVWIADYRADEGLRIRKDNISPCMTSSMKDYPEWNPKAGTRNPPIIGDDHNIRRLTPRECFRLQDFPDSFEMPCSDSQMYKQAGNSITVAVLEKIIARLPNLNG